MSSDRKPLPDHASDRFAELQAEVRGLKIALYEHAIIQVHNKNLDYECQLCGARDRPKEAIPHDEDCPLHGYVPGPRPGESHRLDALRWFLIGVRNTGEGQNGEYPDPVLREEIEDPEQAAERWMKKFEEAWERWHTDD